jgi:ribosomal protein S18 acetylase RimI-like enzyme
MTRTVRLEPARTPAQFETVRGMFREYKAAIGVDLCFQSFEQELAAVESLYGPPGGRVLLAWAHERLAGCGALRSLAPGVAELKRMYVRPAFRGLGLGRRLANALLDAAADLGYRAVRLDTLPAMAEAIGLYRSLGFREIQPYDENPLPGVLYMERALDDRPAASRPPDGARPRRRSEPRP